MSEENKEDHKNLIETIILLILQVEQMGKSSDYQNGDQKKEFVLKNLRELFPELMKKHEDLVHFLIDKFVYLGNNKDILNFVKTISLKKYLCCLK
jgi:hypothetical protein